MRIEKDNQSVYLGAEIVIIFFREEGKMMSLIYKMMKTISKGLYQEYDYNFYVVFVSLWT